MKPMWLFSWELCLSFCMAICSCSYSSIPVLKEKYYVGMTDDDLGRSLNEINFSPTTKYLTDEVGVLFDPPISFENVQLKSNILGDGSSLLSSHIDFVLTSPERLVCHMNGEAELMPLASMLQIVFGHETKQFGAFIIVQSNSLLLSIQDLVNASISLPSLYEPTTLLLWETLDKAGVRLLHDPRQLIIRPRDPTQIMHDVLQGAADAGFVPAVFLDAMAEQGYVHLDGLAILAGSIGTMPAAPERGGAPRLTTSTLSLPGWTLAAVADAVAPAVQRAVLAALLRIENNHPAAIAGSYASWLPPAPLTAFR